MTGEQLEMYPDGPGFKTGGTSKKAAEKIASRVAAIRYLIVGALAARGPMTADEAATHLKLSLLAVRPRFSELKRKGHIVDAGVRRRNDISGREATVWRLTPRAP